MPSSSPFYARIRNNPRFTELVARRNRLTFGLFTTVLILFYGYMSLVSFWPELIGRRLYPGSNLTVGICGGLFLFVFFCLIAGYYVYRANGDFDRITRDLVAQAQAEELA
jgi:uncharacterized membrane protein (DUF485 family)